MENDDPSAPSLEDIQSHLFRFLEDKAAPRLYRKGVKLCSCGHAAERIFLLHQGRVRFLPDFRGRRNLFSALQIAEAGAVIGLGEVISGEPYEMTVETMEESLVSFIERDQLMEYLQTDKNLCLQIVRMLSETLHNLYEHYQTLGGRPGRVKKKQDSSELSGRRPPRPA